MFCSNCGSANEQGSKFCLTCGRQLDATPTVGEGFTAPVSFAPPAKNNKKFLFIGAGALVVILIAAAVVVVNLPKTVSIRMGVTETYGGIFAAQCVVEDDASALVPTSLTVKDASNGNTVADVPLVFLSSGSGGCEGRGDVSLSPNGKFEVFDGSTSLGLIGSPELSSGLANVNISASLLRDLKVSFGLYDTADSCSGSLEKWYCSWDNDWVFGLDLDSDNDSCSGQNGYSDIHAGNIVRVRGRSNNLTETATLKGDSYELTSMSTYEIKCNFYANFSSLPNDPLGYEIEVGTRGTVDYGLADLSSNDWVAEMSIGKD